MIPFDAIKTIFFDYDGTLHNSIRLYAPGFKKAYTFLVDEGYAEARSWTDQEIGYWLGFNPQEMWEAFMPKLSHQLREKCSQIIGIEMQKQMQQIRPQLYEGAIDTLQYLKQQGYHLIFISNCKAYYKECHTQLFNLYKYFENMVCSDDYAFLPKYEILKAVKVNYPEAMVIIGDRKQDIEAGKKNDIFTIGCKYGFALEGELDSADLCINDIRELNQYF